MIYIILQQINANFLSKLITRKFIVSISNLSPKVKKFGNTSRLYSTHSKFSNLDKIDNLQSIRFDSLSSGCEQIKYEFIGVSGVYRLTNKRDSSRFYIGSSTDLARRMEEYNKLTLGLRNPHSVVELEISKNPAIEWNLEFLCLTTPQLSLVYEQYAILKLKPTMNIRYWVVPRVNPQWGNDLNDAISVIEKILTLFPEGYEGHKRFKVWFKSFKIANSLEYTVEDLDSKYWCSLVYVYDKNYLDKSPIVYSSINKAKKGLKICNTTLVNYINNKYIYNSNLIFSFEPLLEESSFAEYREKQAADNQMRKHILLFNHDNEIVFEFKSAREMARFFSVEGRIVRAAIAKGEYLVGDLVFLLITKEISYRKSVYVLDSKTHKVLEKLTSMTKAMQYAKVNFYTLKNLIDSGKSYDGKIYSYTDKL